MSKSVLISIKPKWCEMIANGKKTVEVRKSRPKLETPFKCYIYCTTERNLNEILWTSGIIGKLADKANGKVIGGFVCDEITKFAIDPKYDNLTLIAMAKHSCLSKPQLENYTSGYWLYGWHISDLVIYDKPRKLSEFSHYKKVDWWDYGHHTNKPQWELRYLERPPQSWCYVEEREDNAPN